MIAKTHFVLIAIDSLSQAGCLNHLFHRKGRNSRRLGGEADGEIDGPLGRNYTCVCLDAIAAVSGNDGGDTV